MILKLLEINFIAALLRKRKLSLSNYWLWRARLALKAMELSLHPRQVLRLAGGQKLDIDLREIFNWRHISVSLDNYRRKTTRILVALLNMSERLRWSVLGVLLRTVTRYWCLIIWLVQTERSSLVRALLVYEPHFTWLMWVRCWGLLPRRVFTLICL